MSGNGSDQGNSQGNRWSEEWDEQYSYPKKPEPAPPAAPRSQRPQNSGQQAPQYPSPGYPEQPAQGYPGQGYPNQAYPNQAQPYAGAGSQQSHGYGHAQFNQAPQAGGYRAQKSRVAAGLLGVFLGGFGVHRFYLGNTGVGVAQLVLTCFTGMGAVWGFVEGLMILCNARSFRTDAHGVPLK